MERRTAISSLLALTFASYPGFLFAQFSLDDPYDKKKKDKTKDLSTLKKTKMAMGFVVGERFSPAQSYSRGIINLQEAISKQTKLDFETNFKVILNSDNIFNYSILFFSSENAFDISDAEKANLKKYLETGGFVILDSHPSNTTEERKGDSSLRQMITDTMGTSVKIMPIPKNHDIYSNVNTFEDGPPLGSESAGLAEIKNYLDGIYLGNNIIGVISTKGYFVKWSDLKDNEPQLKMGVNMVIHAIMQK